MKRTIVAISLVAGILLLLAFARYETIAPCGMLRSEAKRQILADLARKPVEDGLEMLGVALGITIIDNTLEAHTASLGPVDCLQALLRLENDDALAAVLADQLRPPSSGVAEPEPERRWTFVSTTDPITDKKFNRAAILTDDASSWIYIGENQFVMGFKPDDALSYRAEELTLRVDTNPAFDLRIYTQANDSAYAVLGEAQVAQMAAGQQLLVRYEAVRGTSLVRLSLTDFTDALAQVGKPTPPPRPPPRPNFSKMSVDERIAYWKKKYDFDGTNSTAKNVRSIWKNCLSLEHLAEPIATTGDKELQFNCVSKGLRLE